MIDEKNLKESLIYCKELGRKSCEAVLKVIDAQPKVGEWIPCSEKLPEMYKPVLVSYKRLSDGFEKICVARMQDGCEWKVEFGGYCNMERIRAWMPLPEPYKEGK